MLGQSEGHYKRLFPTMSTLYRFVCKRDKGLYERIPFRELTQEQRLRESDESCVNLTRAAQTM